MFTFVFPILALLSVSLMGTTAWAAERACVGAISGSNKVRFTEVFKGEAAYEVQIAAAEFLALHGSGSKTSAGIRNVEVEALFASIVEDQLSLRQAEELKDYKDLLRSLVESSPAIARLRILEGDESSAEKPKNMSDILTPPRKSGLISRLRDRLQGGVKGPQFLNAEQFARTLEAYPAGERLDVLRKAAGALPLLTHLEYFRVLAAFPKASQLEVDEIFEGRIFGRLDFFPVKLVEDIAHLVESSIVLAHIRSTGGWFRLPDLLSIFRRSGMSELEISASGLVSYWSFDPSLAQVEVQRHADFTLTPADLPVVVSLALRAAKTWGEKLSYLLLIEKKLISAKDQRVDLNLSDLEVTAHMHENSFLGYSISFGAEITAQNKSRLDIEAVIRASLRSDAKQERADNDRITKAQVLKILRHYGWLYSRNEPLPFWVNRPSYSL